MEFNSNIGQNSVDHQNHQGPITTLGDAKKLMNATIEPSIRFVGRQIKKLEEKPTADGSNESGLKDVSDRCLKNIKLFFSRATIDLENNQDNTLYHSFRKEMKFKDQDELKDADGNTALTKNSKKEFRNSLNKSKIAAKKTIQNLKLDIVTEIAMDKYGSLEETGPNKFDKLDIEEIVKKIAKGGIGAKQISFLSSINKTSKYAFAMKLFKKAESSLGSAKETIISSKDSAIQTKGSKGKEKTKETRESEQTEQTEEAKLATTHKITGGHSNAFSFDGGMIIKKTSTDEVNLYKDINTKEDYKLLKAITPDCTKAEGDSVTIKNLTDDFKPNEFNVIDIKLGRKTYAGDIAKLRSGKSSKLKKLKMAFVDALVSRNFKVVNGSTSIERFKAAKNSKETFDSLIKKHPELTDDLLSQLRTIRTTLNNSRIAFYGHSLLFVMGKDKDGNPKAVVKLINIGNHLTNSEASQNRLGLTHEKLKENTDKGILEMIKSIENVQTSFIETTNKTNSIAKEINKTTPTKGKFIAAGKAKKIYEDETNDKAVLCFAKFLKEGEIKDEVMKAGTIQKTLMEQGVNPEDSNILTSMEELRVEGKKAVLMEKASGDLEGMIGKLTPEQRISVSMQIMNGINNLHQAGYIHGDLKLDNILCYKRDDGTIHVKVADLGKTRKCGHKESVRQEGNPRWAAPEGRVSRKSETWTAAAICIQIMEAPYLNDEGSPLLSVSRDKLKPADQLPKLKVKASAENENPEELKKANKNAREGFLSYLLQHKDCPQMENKLGLGGSRGEIIKWFRQNKLEKAYRNGKGDPLIAPEKSQEATDQYIDKLKIKMTEQMNRNADNPRLLKLLGEELNSPDQSKENQKKAINEFGEILKGLTRSDPSKRMTLEMAMNKLNEIKEDLII